MIALHAAGFFFLLHMFMVFRRLIRCITEIECIYLIVIKPMYRAMIEIHVTANTKP